MTEITIQDCRPEVLAFAIEMERQLRLKDAAKGSGRWRDDHPRALFRHLEEEIRELDRAMKAQLDMEFRDKGPLDDHRGRFSRQCQKTGAEQISTGREFLVVDPNLRAKTVADAAAVANMAMMVADAAAGLLAPAEPKTYGCAA